MLRRSTCRRALGPAALLAGSAAVLLGVSAPPDAVQGNAQRLMYVHVPAAWTAYVCFTAVLVASVGFLLRRDLRWDRWVGVGMTALAIALGSVWGRLTWGVWWTWDARLVTTVVLLLVYVGYLGVRGLGGDAYAGARRAAAVGVIGFVDVPVVHFSVVWWRTLHQPPSVFTPSTAPPVASTMLIALLAALVAFTLVAGWLVVRRVEALSVLAPAPDAPVPEQASPVVVRVTARQ